MKTIHDRQQFPRCVSKPPPRLPLTSREVAEILNQAPMLVLYGRKAGLIRVAHGVTHPVDSKHD